MTTLFFLSAIMMGLLFKKNRFVSAYILGIEYLLSVYKYNCADLQNYKLEYMYVQQGIFNGDNARYIGYYLIQKICSSVGMNFQQFLSVFYILAIGILFFGIRRMTEHVNIVLALYLIYSFSLDSIQMKTFLADAIIIAAISFLIKKPLLDIRKRNKENSQMIIFIVLSLFAVSIHFSTSYFLIVGLLYYIYASKQFEKKVIVIALILTICSYMNIIPSVLKMFSSIIPFFDFHYMLHWFKKRMNFGFLLVVMIVFIMIGLCLLAINILKGELVRGEIDEEVYLLKNRMFKFVFTSLLLLPIVSYDITFGRLFRVYFIILYILVAETVNRYMTIKKMYLYFGTVVALAYMFWLDVYPVYEGTLGAILKFNVLFE